MTVAAALAEVEAAVRAAAAPGGGQRPVRLIAVSKLQPDDRVEAALAAGHRVFGENYVQEAQARWRERRTIHPELELHLVGPLQTNKARDAAALFDVIHSLDRPKLARRLAKDLEETGRRPGLLVQVNTGEEPRKAGVAPAALDGFLDLCRRELGLPIRGLMCIPPADEEPSPHFALLAKLAGRHGLPELSMGMSADYPKAVAFGATMIRVGTAVFGERPPR